VAATSGGRLWGYRISTVLFCLAILPGGITGILLTEQTRQVFTSLGYPMIASQIIGVWKILGVAALLWPGKPRLKEWAYAGFVFDITGASISSLAAGEGALGFFVPMAFLAVLAVSYLLRPASDSLRG